jgi:hypothetical protein
MKPSVQKPWLVALTLMLAGGQVHAAGLCKLTGNYSDDYGSTTSIKGTQGSILNTLFCATAYSFKISDETRTGFNVMGRNKTKSCGTFSASLTFIGSCSAFGGSVDINGQKLSDSFTKEGHAAHIRPATASELTNGIR